MVERSESQKRQFREDREMRQKERDLRKTGGKNLNNMDFFAAFTGNKKFSNLGGTESGGHDSSNREDILNERHGKMNARKLAALKKRQEREERERLLRLEALERQNALELQYQEEEKRKQEALEKAKRIAEEKLKAEEEAKAAEEKRKLEKIQYEQNKKNKELEMRKKIQEERMRKEKERLEKERQAQLQKEQEERELAAKLAAMSEEERLEYWMGFTVSVLVSKNSIQIQIGFCL